VIRTSWVGPAVLLRMLLVTGLLGGCVYYNGMYNANRLAKSARKAEREGRTFDANNLWGQVATKAESVVVRHPTSKYADEAAVLRGLALARLGQCEQALGPLGRAVVIRGNLDLAEEALLAAGRCQVTLGNIAAGDAAFSQLLDSKDSERRSEARYQHARAARQAGRYQEALNALAGISDPRADAERLLALAGTGRVSEALMLADSLVAKGDTTEPWDSLVVAVGRRDPRGASSLVDRIRRLPNRSAENQARLLLEDGQRLVGSDTGRAAARFREAIKVEASSDAAGRANLELIRMDLRGAAQPEDLPPAVQKLQGLASRHPTLSSAASQLGATAAGVLAAAAVTPETTQGDLRLFLAAESARDTLAAPRLANALLHRILNQWPSSPYAPKAILAAQQLDSTWTDSARVLLEGPYVDSPYLALIHGEATPAYRQLEDSLGAYAATLVPPRSAPGGRRAPTRDDDDKPGRRPQPAPSVRVVEPQ
jgi:tetratricopeptide (TPR) repeat protein